MEGDDDGDDHGDELIGMAVPTYISLLEIALQAMPGDATEAQIVHLVDGLPSPSPLQPARNRATGLEEKRMLREVATSLGMFVLRRRTDEKSFRVLADRRKQMGMSPPMRSNAQAEGNGRGVQSRPSVAAQSPAKGPGKVQSATRAVAAATESALVIAAPAMAPAAAAAAALMAAPLGMPSSPPPSPPWSSPPPSLPPSPPDSPRVPTDKHQGDPVQAATPGSATAGAATAGAATAGAATAGAATAGAATAGAVANTSDETHELQGAGCRVQGTSDETHELQGTGHRVQGTSDETHELLQSLSSLLGPMSTLSGAARAQAQQMLASLSQAWAEMDRAAEVAEAVEKAAKQAAAERAAAEKVLADDEAAAAQAAEVERAAVERAAVEKDEAEKAAAERAATGKAAVETAEAQKAEAEEAEAEKAAAQKAAGEALSVLTGVEGETECASDRESDGARLAMKGDSPMRPLRVTGVPLSSTSHSVLAQSSAAAPMLGLSTSHSVLAQSSAAPMLGSPHASPTTKRAKSVTISPDAQGHHPARFLADRPKGSTPPAASAAEAPPNGDEPAVDALGTSEAAPGKPFGTLDEGDVDDQLTLQPAAPYLVEKALMLKFRENPIRMKDLFHEWDQDGECPEGKKIEL